MGSAMRRTNLRPAQGSDPPESVVLEEAAVTSARSDGRVPLRGASVDVLTGPSLSLESPSIPHDSFLGGSRESAQSRRGRSDVRSASSQES